jgi:hypothetical protein
MMRFAEVETFLWQLILKFLFWKGRLRQVGSKTQFIAIAFWLYRFYLGVINSIIHRKHIPYFCSSLDPKNKFCLSGSYFKFVNIKNWSFKKLFLIDHHFVRDQIQYASEVFIFLR